MASLAQTNKHLSTPSKRKKAVLLTIRTSSAIEGIYAPFKRGKVAVKKAGKAKATVTITKRVVTA